jgi:hypothetical protein
VGTSRAGSRRTIAYLISTRRQRRDEKTHLETGLKLKRPGEAGHVVESARAIAHPAPRDHRHQARRAVLAPFEGERPRGGRGHVDVGDLDSLVRRRRRRAGTAPVLSPRCRDDKLDLLLGGRGRVFSSLRRRRRWRGGGVGGRGGGRGGGTVLVAGALGAVDVVRV